MVAKSERAGGSELLVAASAIRSRTAARVGGAEGGLAVLAGADTGASEGPPSVLAEAVT